MTKRGRLSAATILTAIATLGLQLLALVVLSPAAFGHFSMLYLVQAFLFSLQLSIISEAWVRTQRSTSVTAPWAEYSGASTALAALGALVGVVVGGIVGEGWAVTVATGVAVFATTYRASARFHAMRCGEWRYVIPADATAAAITIGALTAALIWPDHLGNLVFVASVWATSAAASSLLSRWPSVVGLGSLWGWISGHRRSITPLLRDSLVMDVSSIGTPYMLAPILGVANFGIYRGVSNVAAPVRMVLNPLRPEFAKWSPTRMKSRQVAALVLITASVFGFLAGAALLLIGALGWQVGTLSALVPFYVPAGIFVAGNFANHSYYLFARQIASSSAMLAARIWQTVVLTGAPVAGALLWGLPGAIWAFAMGTLVSFAGWALAVRG